MSCITAFEAFLMNLFVVHFGFLSLVYENTRLYSMPNLLMTDDTLVVLTLLAHWRLVRVTNNLAA